MSSNTQLNILNYHHAKRLLDIALSTLLLGLFAFPMILIAIRIKGTSPGPVIYWSSRVGVRNRLFRMPKFRTMSVEAPTVATHLFKNSVAYVTGIGKVLRKTSLDELPQLISVIKGDMSLVGPRPALYNQYDLIELRTKKGVHRLIPGVTGWAQINGRDDLPIPEKVDLDEHYLKNQSFVVDIKTLSLTVFSVIASKGITH